MKDDDSHRKVEKVNRDKTSVFVESLSRSVSCSFTLKKDLLDQENMLIFALLFL